MRIIHYEAEKRYVDAGMLLCTVFLLYKKLLSCKVKNGRKLLTKPEDTTIISFVRA